MSNFTVCRVCLAHNIRMHSISNTTLHEIYENLMRTKLITEDGRPVTVCYICFSQLQRCSKFMNLAQHSERLLLQLYHSGIELTQNTVLMIDRGTAYNFSVTPIESMSMCLDLQRTDGVEKSELKHETAVTVKQESTEDTEKSDDKIDNSEIQNGCVSDNVKDAISSSDSEDDVPLHAFKINKIANEININKKTRTIEKVKMMKKRKYRKDIKIDAIEVKLSKEQQIDAVLARSRSLNYLNSPYKCHLCYKGFVNGVTYSNHVEKHDKISGVYKCEICALRYHSARLLRTHASTAHSRYYKCRKCEHVSQTINQARDHEKWHNGFMFECQLCSKKFKKRTSYLTHTRLNHSAENVCNLCGYSFVGKNGLLLHKSKSHKRDSKEENLTVPALERHCGVCNIQFVVLEAYQRHLLTSIRHKSENSSNECIICKLSLPDPGSLTEHMKIHKRKLLHPSSVVIHGAVQAQLHCDVCGATFAGRSRLAAHISRKHLGVKYARPVVCEICGAQFKSAGALRYHQRRHSGSRPYPCASCAKRFADSSQLRAHARTHSGDRPYACHTCHKRFSQKAALNRHHRVHTGIKPYTCQVCAKSFSQTNSLKTHVQTVHLKMPAYRKKKRAAVNNER